MKIIFGGPPTDPVIASQGPGNWQPLTQMCPPKYYCAAVAATIFMTGATIGLLSYFTVFSYSQYAKSHAQSIYYETIIGLFLVAIMHELVHLAASPKFGLSPQSIFGIWPKKLIFYVFYVGQLTKARLVWIASAPMIVLSVLPILLASIFHWNSEQLGLVAIFNSMLSGIDAITMYLILSEIPKSSLVRQSGDNVYYSN